MSKVVVCISRTVAAGGESIGKAVSEQLGYRYVDEEVIKRASEKASLDPTLVAEAEHRTSILSRLIDAITSLRDPAPYLFTSEAPYYPPTADVWLPPAQDDLRDLIREAIKEIAEQGRAVIVAHAASFALGARPEILRVLVTASPATRAQRLPGAAKLLDESDAATAVRESDEERKHYLRRFYDVREELPTHYDLVINTDTLSLNQAVSAILAAARA